MVPGFLPPTVEDQGRVSGFWFWPGTTSAVAITWRMNQKMEKLALLFCVCTCTCVCVFQINKNIKRKGKATYQNVSKLYQFNL